jgi:CheY-like chemotaxis protein
MFVRMHWDVLLVDDDPDVLAVSRLALKHIQVYGIPLKIHECTSKAEAIKYLQVTAELSDLALAIIDVVMETEHAGLDVCKFIREELNNRVTPIVVRTGQAGKAPEREIIERYDISMYLTKTEAINEKLHAAVVSAVRNYQNARAYEAAFGVTSRLISMSETREGVARGLPELMDKLMRYRDGKSFEYYQAHFCILTEREAIAVGKFIGQEAEARALRDRLAKEPLRVINANGDRFARADDHMLISLTRANNMPPFDMIGMTNHQPMPDYQLRALAMFAQCARDLMILADKRASLR